MAHKQLLSFKKITKNEGKRNINLPKNKTFTQFIFVTELSSIFKYIKKSN